MKSSLGSCSSPNRTSPSSLKGEAVEITGSVVTPILAFTHVSDTFAEMSKVYISSKTDLMTMTSGGVETEDVVGVVESIKIDEERGIEI